MFSALLVCFAVAGGIGWSLGSLGKRYGVEAFQVDEKIQIIAILNCWYCLAGVLITLLTLLTQNSSLLTAAFHDPEWRSRLWLIGVGCGGGVTIGCLLSIHAFANARDRRNSAVTAMVMNSVYIVCCPLALAVAFQGSIGLHSFFAMMLVFAGSFALEPYCVSLLSRDASTNSLLVDDHSDHKSASSIGFAVLAGLGWCCGPLSKRYGVPDDTLEERKAAMSILTNVVANGTGFLIVTFWAVLCLRENWAVLGDHKIRQRAPVVLFAGGASGIGGILVTYAMSLADSSASPYVITISNATFTLVAPLAIAASYSERLSYVQALGAALIVLGVTLVICLV